MVWGLTTAGRRERMRRRMAVEILGEALAGGAAHGRLVNQRCSTSGGLRRTRRRLSVVVRSNQEKK